jgi:diguanylate cyclase (GGDEF)-like protein
VGENKIRSMIALLIPGGVIFAIMLVASRLVGLSTWGPLLLPLYPLAVITVALLLGWRFDRSRLVFATAIIGLAGWLLQNYGARHDAIGRISTDAVITLLPLNIALVAVLKERGIFTWHGLLRWAIILVQPLTVWSLLHFRQYYWLGVFDTPIIPLDVLDAVPLEQPTLFGFFAALLLTAYRGVRQHNAMESGLFWALALMLYSLLSGHSHEVLTVFLTSAILILVVAVVEVSYTMAFRDELTGLPGRRALNQALLKLGGRYTIAMLDVDHFKKFNDRFGHDVGDEVLKMVASRMARVSGGGKSFRYGGEEFTVVFAGKNSETALPYLEQLREAIANNPFTVRGPGRPRSKPGKDKGGSRQEVSITISIGAAEREGENRSPQDVIKAADKALYRAKKAGRNRVAS